MNDLYSIKESTIKLIWEESYNLAYPTLDDFIIDYGFKVIHPK